MFYAIVFGVGVLAARRRGGGGQATSLLLAGRQMPLWIAGMTMTATWVGGAYINGTAEAVYGSGMVWAQPPWGYALSLVIGGLFFARKMRSAEYTTLLDPFEARYGKRTAAVLFLPALVGDVFWSAAVLVALGTTFATVLEFDTQTAILISATVAVAYTVVGGLWSVAYTDVVQLVCIMLGLAVAIPFAVEAGGDWSTVTTAYEAKFGDAARLVPPAAAVTGGAGWGYRFWYWADMALLLMLGGVPWGVYFQRVLASRDAGTAVRLSLVGAVGCVAMAIPAGMIGMISAAADWNAAGVEAPEAAMVLPYVLKHLTPPVVATVGLGAIAAAVMSSVDSSILSAASMGAWNIYRPLFRPGATDVELRWVVRGGVVVVGGLATGLALATESVYVLWYLCSDLVYVVLFPQLVMVLYGRGVNWIGAISGAAVGTALRLSAGEVEFGLPALVSYPMVDEEMGSCFPIRTMAMLASLATIWCVSWVSRTFFNVSKS